MGEPLNQIVPPDCLNLTGPDQLNNQISQNATTYYVGINEFSTTTTVVNSTNENEVNSTTSTNTRTSRFPNLHHFRRLEEIQAAIDANNLDIQKQWEKQISSSQILSKSNTKVLAIQIEGQTIKGLFDTGAGATVMSRATATKANCLVHSTTRTCRTADQNYIKIVGETQTEVELNGRKLIQRFLVVDKLNHPIIFGIDFIINFGIIPIIYNNEYCFHDNKEEKYQFLGSTAPTAINVVEVKVKLDLSKYSKGARDIFSKLCDLTIRRELATPASHQEPLSSQKQHNVAKAQNATSYHVVSALNFATVQNATSYDVANAVNEVIVQKVLPESANLYHVQAKSQPSVLPSTNGKISKDQIPVHQLDH